MMNALFYLLVFLFGQSLILGLEPIDFKSITSSLPAGEYQILMKETINCNPPNAKMQFNLYKNENSSEIKGNYTLKIPIDDTLMVEMSFSIKDWSGVWKNNVFVQKLQTPCTMIRKLFGKEWLKLMKDVGQNTSCPIPAGTFKLQGIDISTYKDNNFSKTFIYGIYKVRFHMLRKNELLGCIIVIVEIKRP